MRCNQGYTRSRYPRGTDYIRSHICNYLRFQCRRLRNGNLVIDKNVTSKKTKKRMTIYDKGNEMLRSQSREFAEAHGLEDAFSGMCRFELNLDSKEQIRKSLHIADTNLMTVLSADANPILEFLDEVARGRNSPDDRQEVLCDDVGAEGLRL